MRVWPCPPRRADVSQLKLNSFQNSGFSTIGNSINWFLVAMLAVPYCAPHYSSPDHLLQFTYYAKLNPVSASTVRVSFTTTTDNRLGISNIYTHHSLSSKSINIFFCLSELKWWGAIIACLIQVYNCLFLLIIINILEIKNIDKYICKHEPPRRRVKTSSVLLSNWNIV